MNFCPEWENEIQNSIFCHFQLLIMSLKILLILWEKQIFRMFHSVVQNNCKYFILNLNLDIIRDSLLLQLSLMAVIRVIECFLEWQGKKIYLTFVPTINISALGCTVIATYFLVTSSQAFQKYKVLQWLCITTNRLVCSKHLWWDSQFLLFELYSRSSWWHFCYSNMHTRSVLRTSKFVFLLYLHNGALLWKCGIIIIIIVLDSFSIFCLSPFESVFCLFRIIIAFLPAVCSLNSKVMRYLYTSMLYFHSLWSQVQQLLLFCLALH